MNSHFMGNEHEFIYNLNFSKCKLLPDIESFKYKRKSLNTVCGKIRQIVGEKMLASHGQSGLAQIEGKNRPLLPPCGLE